VTESKPDFLAILNVLAAHEVKFIVVGGVCAVLQGAPVSTFDLDIVHARDPENIGRLLAALHELGAVSREHPDRQIGPDRTHLESPGHQLLLTKAGPLDVLGVVSGGRGYGELVSQVDEMRIGSVSIKVLRLATLIDIKEELGREKDRAVLSILRRTLEEKQRR
jgi:hypothetical protein